jgi:hypothetical protein
VSAEGCRYSPAATRFRDQGVSICTPSKLLGCVAQVTLLSSGYMMYSGEREGIVPWFDQGCGYPYDPAMHGLASDWIMDLVNVGFTKPEVCHRPVFIQHLSRVIVPGRNKQVTFADLRQLWVPSRLGMCTLHTSPPAPRGCSG